MMFDASGNFAAWQEAAVREDGAHAQLPMLDAALRDAVAVRDEPLGGGDSPAILGEARRRLRDAFAGMQAASGGAVEPEELRAVARKVLTEMGEEAGQELRRALAPPPRVIMSGTQRQDRAPAPILWRDRDSFYAEDPVLCAGECAVLAGAGSAGKSWLAIRLAVEAGRAARDGEDAGAACGLRVRAGPVVILSYEMSAKRMDMAAEAMDSPEGVPVLPSPQPLFPGRRGEHAEGPAWRPTWAALAAADPVMIVIDTGPKAMGGADVNDGAPVIAFLQAIERELAAMARPGQPAPGALLIAHDTKAMRDATRAGEDVGAGAIAGSGQWFDSPRGALHLSKVAGSDIRFLECIKASNGRQHWGSRLTDLWVQTGNGSRYAGLQLDPQDGARIEPGGMMAARKEAEEAVRQSGEAPPARGKYT